MKMSLISLLLLLLLSLPCLPVSTPLSSFPPFSFAHLRHLSVGVSRFPLSRLAAVFGCVGPKARSRRQRRLCPRVIQLGRIGSPPSVAANHRRSRSQQSGSFFWTNAAQPRVNQSGPSRLCFLVIHNTATVIIITARLVKYTQTGSFVWFLFLILKSEAEEQHSMKSLVIPGRGLSELLPVPGHHGACLCLLWLAAVAHL